MYSVPDDQVTAAVDVSAWLEQKVAAVLAHRSEVERGALPGLIVGLSPEQQGQLLTKEWYVRHDLTPASGTPTGTRSELTA